MVCPREKEEKKEEEITIAIYDGKSIAADRQITAGNFIMAYEKKILQYSKGWYIAAGRVSDGEPFKSWLEKKTKFQPDKHFQALYTVGKTVWFIDSSLLPYKAYVPYAIGMNTDVAEELVRSGMTAKEAVQRMCKTNIYCSGPVDVVVLE